MKIEKGSKLVFIGDSISDFERARPYGEGLFGGIGKSYVGLVDAMLKTTYPESKIRVINMGIAGNNTRDLLARWDTDVMDLHPDWLGILIGINDVWRQFDSPLLTEQHVGVEEYEQNLRIMIERTLPTLKGLILMTPYFMETNRQDPMRIRMEQYAQVVKKLAEEYGAVFVDLQAAFDQYFEHYHPMSVNWDYIHPDIVGHTIIMRAVLKALDYEW
ncbi:MAG: SGNH/GDSL hydrolase family protein [Massiliimalia sp.]|jgi:lysophospholipase L1-like esterase